MSDHVQQDGLESLSDIRALIGRRRPAFFLDLDGTLPPLTPRSESVDIAPAMKDVLVTLAREYTVCITTGRALADIRARIGLPGLYYAADHGHRISGPPSAGVDFEVVPEDRGGLETAAYELERGLHHIDGAFVETKGIGLSVHYGLVAEDLRPTVERTVAEIATTLPEFKLTTAKSVCELVPASHWNKGRAVLWLLRRLRLGRVDTCPVCLGDDLTDENMFTAIRSWGVSLRVGDPEESTRAEYSLRDYDQAVVFLRALGGRLGDTSSPTG